MKKKILTTILSVGCILAISTGASAQLSVDEFEKLYQEEIKDTFKLTKEDDTFSSKFDLYKGFSINIEGTQNKNSEIESLSITYPISIDELEKMDTDGLEKLLSGDTQNLTKLELMGLGSLMNSANTISYLANEEFDTDTFLSVLVDFVDDIKTPIHIDEWKFSFESEDDESAKFIATIE